MRILVLSTWFPFPPDNGAKIRAYQLLQALARRHELTLVAFDPEDRHPNAAAFDLLAEIDLHPVVADPYRYVNLPAWRRFVSPIPLAFRRIPIFEACIREVTVGKRWDCAVAFQVHVARYTLQVDARSAVLDVDTALSYQMYERYLQSRSLIPQVRTWASYQKALWYERRLCRQFAACTVVSPEEIEHLERLVGPSGRVALVSNGVDSQHNQPGLTQKRPHTLIYNGALTYSANYDAMQYFLSEIYPLIKREIPDVTLKITGSTHGVDLRGLPLDESVHLTGYVKDVRFPVAESSVCVIPLREGGGTRLKILEAMALGTPVVSTPKGAEGLQVVPGQHLLVADDPPLFARQVVRLLRDPDAQRRLATHARALVEGEYDWQNIGEQFVTLVEEVM